MQAQLCSKCQQRPCNVFLSTSINGRTSSRSLCSNCANGQRILVNFLTGFGFPQVRRAQQTLQKPKSILHELERALQFAVQAQDFRKAAELKKKIDEFGRG